MPVNVIGHCLGAQLTHDIVRKNRDLVKNVVWYSPVLSVQAVFKRVLRRAVDEHLLDLNTMTTEQRAIHAQFLRTADEDFTGKEVSMVLQILPHIRDFQHLYWHDKAAMARYLEQMKDRPMAIDVFVKMSTDYFERGGLPIPSYENIPVLMLYSDNDEITPWETNGAQILKSIPHTKTRLISGGCHWLHLEKPEECARATTDFFNS
jgi:pimeloyl-ACP methyl ester carboxylesterase